MRFRKLRIAWSAFWGLACVLLIVLWVRSYWWADMYHLSSTRVQLGVLSVRGCLAFNSGSTNFNPGYQSVTAGALVLESIEEPILWFHYRPRPLPPILYVPIWPLPMILMVIAVASWFRNRFTIRTLLIATTLVAVVLGLIVYAVSK
jgi:hypothetical protein